MQLIIDTSDDTEGGSIFDRIKNKVRYFIGLESDNNNSK